MRHFIFDVPVDDFSKQELKDLLKSWLQNEQGKMIVTPNPEFLLLAKTSADFRSLLNRADLAIADGVGLRFAISALTNERLKHRQTGVDLVELLCELAETEQKTVLFFGGDPTMAEKAKQQMLQRFPQLSLKAFDPGQLKGDQSHVDISQDLIEKIKILHPDILLVGLGQGKQERFIAQLLQHIPTIAISVGVGGSFETLSGTKPRAPEALRKRGFEWVWRLCIEPKRAKRIFRASVIFPFTVLSATLKQKIFLKALKRTLPEIWNQLRNKS